MKRNGFSLVELLVSMLIVSIAMLGFAALQACVQTAGPALDLYPYGVYIKFCRYPCGVWQSLS